MPFHHNPSTLALAPCSSSSLVLSKEHRPQLLPLLEVPGQNPITDSSVSPVTAADVEEAIYLNRH